MWGPVFDRIIEEVEPLEHVQTLGLDEEDEASYLRANEAILSWARQLAEQANQPASALVVWDVVSRGPQDVTAAFIETAKRRRLAMREISTCQPTEKVPGNIEKRRGT